MQIIKCVKEKPDITLEEIIKELKLPIKKSRVSKILLGEKIFKKKKQVHAAEQKRKDVVQTRKEWKEKQENNKFLADKLVFWDESGVNNLLYGDAVLGCMIKRNAEQ